MGKLHPIGDWRDLRALNRSDQVEPRSPANLLLCMREHPTLEKAFGWNEITSEIELTRDIDGIGKIGQVVESRTMQLLTVWLERYEGLRPSHTDLEKSLYV